MDALKEASNKLVFYVNGKRIEEVNPSPTVLLATYLRQTLGLTGTKVGCSSGGCGSCTVTVSRPGPDGSFQHLAVNACITKIVSLHGAAVTTVEGLGTPRTGIHPVQERIYKAHGSQCGFCTPGMVMSMSSKLRGQNGVVDIEDVEKCLQGNLCRCTGYRPILEAFKTFAPEGAKALQETEVATFDPKSFETYEPKKHDPRIPEELEGSELHRQFVSFEHDGQRWIRPSSFSELKELTAVLPSVEYYQGGTGKYLVFDPKQKAANIIQINHIEALRTIMLGPTGTLAIGSAVTLSELSEWTKKYEAENPTIKALEKVLGKLASEQIRNVGSVGGHIMWAHPCSDLRTFLLALKSSVKILENGSITEKVLDETFLLEDVKEIKHKGTLIVSVEIDINAYSAAGYYRKARRNEFDLPIANLAIFANLHGEQIQDISVAIGGMESSIGSIAGLHTSTATNIEKLLKKRSIGSVSPSDLADAALLDVKTDDKSPGDYSTLRKCLIVTFIKAFLSQNASNAQPQPQALPKSSHHLFQKPAEDQAETDLVERPIPHMWAAEQACGTATYVDDIPSTRHELQMVLVLSSKAHAKIVSIDFSEAEKVKGVVETISGKDIEEKKNYWGLIANDEPIFATAEVEYHGQVVAAILCENLEAGRKARQLVKIEYEDLPFHLTIDEARKLDAKLAPMQTMKRIQEDVSDKLPKAVTIQGVVRLGAQEHFYLEPHACLAVPSTEKEEMTIYVATQEPDNVHQKVSAALGVPSHKIAIKCKRAGGAFGGKERMHNALMAAVAAKKFNRPVRLVYSRKEDFLTTGHRHELVTEYKVDVEKSSGKILHIRFDAFANAGVSLDLSVPWVHSLIYRIDGGYTLKNFEAYGTANKTNTPSNTAFRGFGGPEGQMVIETIMDHIAHKLELDPVKVREANLTQSNDLLHHGTKRVGESMLERCWNECLAQSKYWEKRQEIDAFNKSNQNIKRGLAIVPAKFAVTMGMKLLMQGVALVRIFLDGSVLLSIGGIEMGQGLYTKMIQVASRVLRIDASLIHINETSSDVTANVPATGGSTGSDVNGPAVMSACQTLMDRLKPIKESMPKASWQDVIKAAWASRINLSAVGFNDMSESEIGIDFEKNTGSNFDYLTYGVGCCEVEVNCETGDVTVNSVDMVMDVGRSLNPAIDIGQIEGAFIQGLGWATNEQLLYSPSTGQLLTDGPGSYKIPGVSDIPRSFNVTLLKKSTGPASAVYSSKGVGEPPILCSTAIPLAIRNAVDAYRREQGVHEWFHLDLPATADKIRAAARDEVLEKVWKTNVTDKWGIQT